MGTFCCRLYAPNDMFSKRILLDECLWEFGGSFLCPDTKLNIILDLDVIADYLKYLVDGYTNRKEFWKCKGILVELWNFK